MILVDVYVNSVDKHYDMYVDSNDTIYEVISNIVDMVVNIEKTKISGRIEEMLLCNIDSGTIMRIDTKLNEYGVENGSKLLLV